MVFLSGLPSNLKFDSLVTSNGSGLMVIALPIGLATGHLRKQAWTDSQLRSATGIAWTCLRIVAMSSWNVTKKWTRLDSWGAYCKPTFSPSSICLRFVRFVSLPKEAASPWQISKFCDSFSWEPNCTNPMLASRVMWAYRTPTFSKICPCKKPRFV